MVILSPEDCNKLRYITDIIYDEKEISISIRENISNCINYSYKYNKKFQLSVDVAHINKYGDIINILKESIPVIIDWDVFVSEYLFRINSRPSKTLTRRDREVLGVGDYTTSYFILATSLKYNYIPEIILNAHYSYTPEIIEYLYDTPHKSLLLYKIYEYLDVYYINVDHKLDPYSTEDINVEKNLSHTFKTFKPTMRNMYYFLTRLGRGLTIQQAYEFNTNVVTFKDVCEYLNISSIEPYYFNKFYNEIISKDTTLDDLLTDKFTSKYLTSLGNSMKSIRKINNFLNSKQCSKLNKILDVAEYEKFDCKIMPYDYKTMKEVSKSLGQSIERDIMKVSDISQGLIDRDVFSLWYIISLGKINENYESIILLEKEEKRIISSDLFSLSDYVLSAFIEYPIPEVIYKLSYLRVAEIIETIFIPGYKVLCLYKIYQALNSYFPNNMLYWTKAYHYKRKIDSNRAKYLLIKYYDDEDDEDELFSRTDEFVIGRYRHIIPELRDIFPFEPNSKNIYLFFVKASKGYSFEECCDIDEDDITFLEVCKLIDFEIIPASLFQTYYDNFKRGIMSEEKLVRDKRIKNYLSHMGKDVRDYYIQEIRE